MSGEIIVIVAVGLALGGLILTSSRGLRQDMRDMRQDFDPDGVAVGWQDQWAGVPD